MGATVRSSSWVQFSRSLAVLAVVECVLGGQFGVTIGVTKFEQNKKFELERSIARYRHLFNHKSTRHVLQEKEKEKEKDGFKDLNQVKTENAETELDVQKTEKRVEEFRDEEPQLILHEKATAHQVNDPESEDNQNSKDRQQQSEGMIEFPENSVEQQDTKNTDVEKNTADEEKIEKESEPQFEENKNLNDRQQVQDELLETNENRNGHQEHSEENLGSPATNQKWIDHQLQSEDSTDLHDSNDNPNNNQQRTEENVELTPENHENPNDNERQSQENVEQPENNVDSNDHQQKLEEIVELVERSEEQQEKGYEEKIEDEKKEVPFVYPEPYLLGPSIKGWDEKRARWLDENPQFKPTSVIKPRVLIVTGSQPWPCQSPLGDNFHVRSLKIKIDYARMHNYQIYYNFAWLDPLFGSYWVKLPILRKLMLTHPEIEWFFWVDSDAVFTDLLFEAPFESYDRDGTNMIMWGWHKGFFVERNWIAINAGVFLLRNCQWSLDLFDKWSPMGPDGPVRDEYGKMLTKFLSHRDENYPADDQSALAYLLLAGEGFVSKVRIVEDEYRVSQWWVDVKDKFEMFAEKYHPGLGDARWPWITHFTGCSPCHGNNNPDYSYEMCMENFERAYIFADNQVLAYMGYEHESLKSQNVIRTRNETDRPLDCLDINPWAERIAQVQGEET